MKDTGSFSPDKLTHFNTLIPVGNKMSYGLKQTTNLQLKAAGLFSCV